MERILNAIAVACTLVLVIWAWRVVNWVWLSPKKLERCLREQGFKGNSYRLLFGDLKESSMMIKDAMSRPIHLTNDIAHRVVPFIQHCIKVHGNNSFMWYGPTPRVNIMEPELIKDILSKHLIFHKKKLNPLTNLLTSGLAKYDGEKWDKHRKIINPAFHMDKLKVMLPAFYLSCSEMISQWETKVSTYGSCELDVWPDIEALSSDIISRTAFGSNYKEGKRIFQLQKEQADHTIKALNSVYIPGWRFMPTRRNKRMKNICKEVDASLSDIINKRMKAMKVGEACNSDLLGILLESNLRAIGENGNNKKLGMSIREVMEECKLFYLAGNKTTSSLLVWTMVLLASHEIWQQKAREEVLQAFGNHMPDFDGLSQLKIVTMILYEVLRLYPPIVVLTRLIKEEVKIGGRLHLPAGVELTLPAILVNRDEKIWGSDAGEFKPSRFSEGVLKATKSPASFFPFGGGPRICIGKNFAMLEAKMAMAMILQKFSFELSTSYAHACTTVITLQPQYGAHLILHKL